MTKFEMAQAILLMAKQLADTVNDNAQKGRWERAGSPAAIKRECLAIRDMALKLSKAV